MTLSFIVNPASNLVFWMSNLFNVVINIVFLLILDSVLDT